MSLKVKYVVTAINITCLVCTLLYPNPATAISLLPIIVTAVTWIFDQRETNPEKERIWPCVLACLVGAGSFLLGVTSSPILGDVGWIMEFREEVAFVAGKYIPYSLFTVIVLVMVIPIYVGDIIYTKRNNTKRDDGSDGIDDRIRRELASQR